ncbi:fatty acid-binding protein type 3-like [Saccoglossus kowalevskii]|uniref:Fatty acid-binding protein, brain-like n=1 Tax=Saccoglossus kowalevskii TaxID=10224 RepID=A0ABM0LYA3_SACKO|nr:PREDICTED: fatty acid-binding protein, brain-like [Saccoglossus kowalevskii]
MSKLVGEWKLDRSEKFDEILAAQGVGWVPRKMITMLSPTHGISEDEGCWTLSMISPMMTKVTKFKIGEPYKDEGFGGTGEKMMVASMDGDKLILMAVDRPEENLVTTREVMNEELVITMKLGDVISKRYFEKIKK